MRTLAAVLGAMCILTVGCVSGQQMPWRPGRQVPVVEGSSATTPTPGASTPAPLPVLPEATKTRPELSRYAMFLTPQSSAPVPPPVEVTPSAATPTLVPATATPSAAPAVATPTPRPQPSPSPTPRWTAGPDGGQDSGRGPGSSRGPASPSPTPTPTPRPSPTATPVRPSPTPAQGGPDGASGTPVLSIAPAQASLAVGEVVPVEIVLSAVPAGLSGFDLTVAVQGASVVELVKAELPDFGLVSTSPVPSGSVRLRAADINGLVSAGMQQVVLARVYLRGRSPGSASLAMALTGLDDERGYPIEISLASATVTTQ